MSPKQKKIAAKAPPPNKITGADFAVLKKEKAKGRGMGLQDESIKPGKVMKARDGKAIKPDPTAPINRVAPKVTDVLKKKKLPGRIGTALGIGAMMVPAAYAAMKQYKDYKSAKNRDKAKVKKYSVGGGADMGRKNKKSKSGSSVKDIFKSYGKYDGKPIELSKGGGADMGRAGERRSKLLTAVQKAGLTGAARPISSSVIKAARKFRDNYKADVRDQAKVKKMGGGMMRRYSSGAMAEDRAMEGRKAAYKKMGFEAMMKSGEIKFPGQNKKRTRENPMKEERFQRTRQSQIAKVVGKENVSDPRKVERKMGGGMMQRPMGYKKGVMVKARGCKLGRTRPTKIT